MQSDGGTAKAELWNRWIGLTGALCSAAVRFGILVRVAKLVRWERRMPVGIAVLGLCSYQGTLLFKGILLFTKKKTKAEDQNGAVPDG
jgi:hypothetical protein